MRNSISSIFICVSILVSGCAQRVNRSISTDSVLVTEIQLLSEPLADWGLVDDPTLFRWNFSLAIHWIHLTGQSTQLCYSALTSGEQELSEPGLIELIDDSGNAIKLLSVIPLARLDRLEFGILVFEPRRIGTHDLSLRLASAPDIQAIIARLVGLQDDLDAFYSAARTGSTEQAGYRISFAGWGMLPSSETATATPIDSGVDTEDYLSTSQPTSTPVPRSSTVGAVTGEIIQEEASLRIENTGNREIHYLAVQLLANGQVVGLLDGTVASTYIPTLTPTAPPSNIYPIQTAVPLNPYPNP